MRYADRERVEVSHPVEPGEQEWYPGVVLELTFEKGKKYAAHYHTDPMFKVAVSEDLYLVDAEFPTGKIQRVPRFARDIRPVKPEMVTA